MNHSLVPSCIFPAARADSDNVSIALLTLCLTIGPRIFVYNVAVANQVEFEYPAATVAGNHVVVYVVDTLNRPERNGYLEI
ncbi:hypothetical protein [Arthrobacter rhombi]|uniref:hypothetical protein n=1 Tax=Arthrobacter rhombi TaxID=71253 RepID=UPI003FCF2C23